MKILMMVLMVMVSGCKLGAETSEAVEAVEVVEVDSVYIVTGQSNSTRCDWSYFEGITGSTVVSIGISGSHIFGLVHYYDSEIVSGLNPAGIIFVHGETDAYEKTDLAVYIDKVESYRRIISGDASKSLPLYISSVGYSGTLLDEDFDNLRDAVVEEAKLNDSWFISFEDAKYFREWGMLGDPVHFTEEGCQLMMNGIAQSLP